MSELISHAVWSGEELWRGPIADHAAVQSVMARAAASAREWRGTALDHRIECLQRYQQLVADEHEALAELIARETGKALWEARGEAGAVAAKVSVTIDAWFERADEQRLEDGSGLVRHRALGTCVVIGPFNFPAHLPNGQIVPALLAGNTVVFKPSEHSPAVGAWLVERLHRAGIPSGVIQLVHGGREPAESLIDHPDTAAVFFTGSHAVGCAIHRRLAGRPEVLLALEMGGNNPLVVWDAEDLEAVVRTVVNSAFITAGQRCTCARRLIVPDSSFGRAVIDGVVAAVPRLRFGDPLAEDQPFAGPLINLGAAEAARARIIELDQRAHSLVAGEGSQDHPALVRPAVFDVSDVDCGDGECFAPVLQVVRVADFNDAIARANHTSYGLAAALVTADEQLWQRFTREIRAGVINRNRATTGASGRLPFGGLGASDNHRAAGFHAIDFCADPVAVMSSDVLACPPLPTGMEDPS